MPIRGLTHREASFAQIGAIRKGAPKEPDRPGADLEYFRVEFDEQENETAELFRSIYGEEPAEIRILLPFDDVDRNFDAWQESYVRGGLIHRCDGEVVEYEVDPTTGKTLVLNGEPYKECGFDTCRPSGRLNVLIADLARLAFLTFRTGSKHDIMNIHRQLTAIKEINGKLDGIPLVMRRRPYMISTPSPDSPSGKARREKWLVSIEADPDWVKAKLDLMQRTSMPGLTFSEGEELPLLEAPEDGVIEEIEDGDSQDPPEAESAAEPVVDQEQGLAPDKLKIFLWDVIENADPKMAQYFEKERDDVMQLMAEQFLLTPDPEMARDDVIEYLFDNRVIAQQPPQVWHAIWRWLNVQVVEGGKVAIGRPEAVVEMQRVYIAYNKEDSNGEAKAEAETEE